MGIIDNLKLDNDGVAKAIDKKMAQLLEQGSADTARLEREAENMPEDATAWFDLGVSLITDAGTVDYLMDQKRLLEATEEETVRESGTEAKTPLYEKALACFAKAMEIDPEYYGIQYQKGIVYANMQAHAEAEQCFLQALREDEEDFMAAQALSALYGDMGDAERSAHYAEMAARMASE